MLTKNDIFPIGIGTWGIGGFADPIADYDEKHAIDALDSCLKQGMNYLEIMYMYAQGRTVDIFANALRSLKIDKEKIFITLSVHTKTCNTIADVQRGFEKFLTQCQIDYIDNLQFTMSLIKRLGFSDIFSLIENLIQSKKIRYASITNANLQFLKMFHDSLENHLFAHEACYNFEIRENQEIVDYCLQHDILNVIYQPLRRNRTSQRNWPLLIELSKKYERTQNQILLNWLVSKNLLILVKSTNKAHVQENLASLNFQLEDSDIALLNKFIVPGYVSPSIDWEDTGNGVPIHMLPNVFDEQMDRLKAD